MVMVRGWAPVVLTTPRTGVVKAEGLELGGSVKFR